MKVQPHARVEAQCGSRSHDKRVEYLVRVGGVPSLVGCYFDRLAPDYVLAPRAEHDCRADTVGEKIEMAAHVRGLWR